MSIFLAFLAILGGAALLLGVIVALLVWGCRRLDRAENAASGFQRDEPYVEPAPYTQTTEQADDFLRGDFDPRAGLDRLRADIAKARAEDDPTAPTRLRHIPAQRKEQP